ncbi:MAG TPA: hypothetical protein VFK57_15920 [Vicinamibacterales bacterium]|nr:hypothetical protein [Vicinamibacterales bacterium]
MLALLKRPAPLWEQKVFSTPKDDDGEAAERIRCPLCDWTPGPSSRWCCYAEGTPEPPFEWCGTTWNTFSTRGRCPGCAHQWKWTSCLRCGGFSLHEDWYECVR